MKEELEKLPLALLPISGYRPGPFTIFASIVEEMKLLESLEEGFNRRNEEGEGESWIYVASRLQKIWENPN